MTSRVFGRQEEKTAIHWKSNYTARISGFLTFLVREVIPGKASTCGPSPSCLRHPSPRWKYRGILCEWAMWAGTAKRNRPHSWVRSGFGDLGHRRLYFV